ncbi:NAD(P)-binding protein [Streptomyces antibioticus]|uniref:NAD(P)-binding protein n=1 Tax=Streptomyces antibioticus TaxID=1890 RepID=UPI003D75995F
MVIGGGQAGLAAGHRLRRKGLGFVILDAEAAPGGSRQHMCDSLHPCSPAEHSSPPGRAARAAERLPARPTFSRLTAGGVRWGDGGEAGADAMVRCTGFRPALSHLAPLNPRGPRGRIPTDGPRALGEPRLHLLGHGDRPGPASAALVGVGRTAREAAREVTGPLPEAPERPPRRHRPVLRLRTAPLVCATPGHSSRQRCGADGRRADGRRRGRDRPRRNRPGPRHRASAQRGQAHAPPAFRLLQPVGTAAARLVPDRFGGRPPVRRPRAFPAAPGWGHAAAETPSSIWPMTASTDGSTR